MMKPLAPEASFDESEMEGLATVAATFYDLLAKVRPEIGKLAESERRIVRKQLIVDSAVMMHGYASLMREFNDAIATDGLKKASSDWLGKLECLSSRRRYTFEQWSGDLFEKRNPLWQRIGVVKPGRDGKNLTVLNTGAARSECGRILRQLISTPGSPQNLRYLTMR
jgi:hypothetical protein